MSTFRVVTQVENPNVSISDIAEQLAAMHDDDQANFFDSFISHLLRLCDSRMAAENQLLSIGDRIDDDTRRLLSILSDEEVTA